MRQVLLGLVTALGLAGASLAQPVTIDPNSGPNGGQVNVSGATLFRPFFAAPQSTNDFIDVDGDGLFQNFPNFPFVDQLATTFVDGQPLTTTWAMQYRGVGSVNGLEEFTTSQLCNRLRGSVPSERGLLNRFEWAAGGVKTGGPNAGLDWLTFDPLYPFNISFPQAQYGFVGANGTKADDSGTRLGTTEVHIAILDVPSTYAIVAGNPADAYWGRGPTESGYGYCPILSNTGWSNQMESLTKDCGAHNGGVKSLNANGIDQNSVFDTTVAWACIVYLANRGVGRPDLNGDGIAGDMALTDIRHCMLTGRTISGENLMVATRSGGSGTRNGIMNSTGIDPSWGRGDNTDTEWIQDNLGNVGPDRKSSNAESSGGIERAVQCQRLAVGYTGLFGSGRAITDASAGDYEILNIQFDDRGGSAYVRPSITSVVQNCDPNSGYTLGGLVSFVSRGDPYETDPNSPIYMQARPAAAYLRNISESILSISDPNGPADPNSVFNMPGEYLVTRFSLVAGVSCLPVTSAPDVFVPQSPATFRPAVQQISINTNPNPPAYGAVNSAGKTPRRARINPDGTKEHPSLEPNTFWLDGTPVTATTYRYKGADGNFYTINRDAPLGSRNRVTGDFNRDGLRNINDIPRMFVAYADPTGYGAHPLELPALPNDPAQTPQPGGNVAIVHIMGDFNADGNFDADDIRYFADGLALDPNFPNGKYGPILNRKRGFTLVDQTWATQPGGDDNFFDTVLATPKAYAPGDSRGDIAGATPVAGASPMGHDGIVDAKDIDYVYRQFKNEYLGYSNTSVNWNNPDQAVYSDASADMTGPEILPIGGGVPALIIDQKDVDELVLVILGTQYGDANLDGVVDAADCAIVEANLGQPGGWAQGDFNGDGIVNALDQAIAGCGGVPAGCPGDSDCDGDVDFDDIDFFVAALSGETAWVDLHLAVFGVAPTCAYSNNDVNGVDGVTFDDIDPFVAAIGSICP